MHHQRSEKSLLPSELSVGQVARRSGVAVSALHFYESKQLIFSRRNEAGQRRYSRDVLRRIAIIKTAQKLGIALAEISAAFDELPTQRQPSAQDWRRLSTRWRQGLTQRIEHLIALRDQLDTCIGCGCLSLQECPLRNPGDIAATAGSGAQRL